jgi:hypothetical protein
MYRIQFKKTFNVLIFVFEKIKMQKLKAVNNHLSAWKGNAEFVGF